MFKKTVTDKDVDLAVGSITKAVANLEALADRADREATSMMEESKRLSALSTEQTLLASKSDGIAAKLRDLVS